MWSNGKKKAIVDPLVWESCEVGGKEATGEKDKVCSMRSSLFKRNATQNQNAMFHLQGQHDQELVFALPAEAEALQVPFQHEMISLQYSEYRKANKKDWVRDIFAIVHNPLRSELKDMTILLGSIKMVGPQLRIGDFSAVRPWWQICSGVILDYLDAEGKYLLPWIETAVKGESAQSTPPGEFLGAAEERRKEIRDVIYQAANMFKELCDMEDQASKSKPKMSNSQKAIVLLGTLDALVFRLGEYINKEEELFPDLLVAHYKSEKKERDVIIGKIVKFYVKKGRRCDSMIVLLTRWMEDAKAQKNFKKALMDIYDCNYKSLQTAFEVDHAGFVQQYKIRAGIRHTSKPF